MRCPGRALTLLALVAGTLHAGAAPAGADQGLRFESHKTYVVDVPAAAVHVTHDVTLRNETPDEVVPGGVRQFFYPEIRLPVLAEATNVAAASGDRTLPVRVEPRDGTVAVLVVDLRPDLANGQTQQIRLTYDLPAQPPRSPTFTRVNEAFTTILAFTTGDPNRTTVDIVVPDSFEVESSGADLTRTERDGVVVLSSGPIEDPSTWTALVSGADDDKLLKRSFDVEHRAFLVAAFPGDDQWATFVEDTTRRTVPVLEGLVGQEWPLDDRLEIVESPSPYVYGYAGWFLPHEDRIEVGEALDAHVLLHEISHLWVNSSMFTDRWISEGIAEVLAARTLAAIGEEPLPPKPIDPTAPGFVALAHWTQPTFQSDVADAREAYGYDASYAVVDQIVAEIGEGALREVLVAAADRRLAYDGDADTEPTRRVGSRRLLDLFEEIGGSQRATELFGRFVFAETEQTFLLERAAARGRYAELRDAGGEWTPPVFVREAMGGWRFGEATAAMEDAREVLEVRDELAAAVRGTDLDVPEAFERAYEEADEADELTELADGAPAYLDAAAAIEQARREIGADKDVFETIGGWFSGAGDELADARAQFDRGDPGAALHHARRAAEIAAGADSRGRERTAIAAALLLCVVVVVVTTVRLRRRGTPMTTAG